MSLADCNACSLGVLIVINPGMTPEIHRCDKCKAIESDEKAAKQVAWILHATRAAVARATASPPEDP